MSLIEIPLFKYIVAILAPSLLALATYPVWRKFRPISTAYCVFSWVLGFVIVQYLGSLVASQHMIKSIGKPVTEEELASIPDGPNITASWILLGWLAPLFTMLTIKAIRSRTKHTSSSS